MLRFLCVAALLLVAAACGDDGSTPGPEPVPVCLGQLCDAGAQDVILTCPDAGGRWYGDCTDGVPTPETLRRACSPDHDIVCIGPVAAAVPCQVDTDCVGVCGADFWCRRP